MRYVGAHVSMAGGLFNAPLNASAIGAHGFSLFTRNQRKWTSPDLKPDEIRRFKETCETEGFQPHQILPHNSYLINLGSPDPRQLEKSRSAFLIEVERCRILGLIMLNFHPGSHRGLMSEENCLELISESINWTLSRTEDVTFVIENTSGQGGQVGYRLEHLADIIAGVTDKSRIGICLDTCHLFSAGYDIRTENGYRRTMDTVEQTIGISYLKGMHLNDSKAKLGSRIDRHHSLGQGELGIEPFRLIMNDPRTDSIPLILETIDPSIWETEIQTLYRLQKSA